MKRSVYWQFLFRASVPHAQVMWVRTDLLKQYNIEVPKTWDWVVGMKL